MIDQPFPAPSAEPSPAQAPLPSRHGAFATVSHQVSRLRDRIDARCGGEAAATVACECADALRRVLDVLEDEAATRRALELELRETRRELHESRAIEREARHSAFHDTLTGLPNRASFAERWGLAVARRQPSAAKIGVLFIDLDGFKAVNDVHGHRVGDELLKIVAARLGRSMRAQDIVSRHGGDEFVCLLPDVENEQQVARAASKLIDAVSAPCTLGRLTLTVRPSIGIAVYPDDGRTVEQLVESADRAMYTARQLHRRASDAAGSTDGPNQDGS